MTFEGAVDDRPTCVDSVSVSTECGPHQVRCGRKSFGNNCMSTRRRDVGATLYDASATGPR